MLKKVPSIKKVVIVACSGAGIEKRVKISIEVYNWEKLINKKKKNQTSACSLVISF